MTLNKDSVEQIFRNIFSEPFLDSCVFSDDGIRYPNGGRQVYRQFISYQDEVSFYFINNNSDTSQCVYFYLPYNYYELYFMQEFANLKSWVRPQLTAKLEFEDVAGNKFCDTYELSYAVYGGGSLGKNASGGGQIIAKRISKK